MKHSLLLAAALLAATAVTPTRVQAYTTDDLDGKLVMWTSQGSYLELSRPNESGWFHFEKIDDTRMKLCGFPNETQGNLTCTLQNGNTIVIPLNNGSYGQTYTGGQGNYPWEVYRGSIDDISNYYQYVNGYGYFTTVSYHIDQESSWVGTLQDNDGTLNLTFPVVTGQWTIIADENSEYVPHIYAGINAIIVEANAIETMTDTDNEVESSYAKVVRRNDKSISFFNFGAAGLAINTYTLNGTPGVLQKITSTIDGTYDPANHTVTLPRQQALQNQIGGMPDEYYGYANDFGPEVFEFAKQGKVTITPTEPVKVYFQGDANGGNINGTYVDAFRHTGANRWDVDDHGQLLTQEVTTYTFPTVWQVYEGEESDCSDSNFRYKSVIEVEGDTLTLAMDNDLQRYGFDTTNGLYVGGKLHITAHPETFDHAELWLAPGIENDIDGQTLDDNSGLKNAINITSNVCDYYWDQTGLPRPASDDPYMTNPDFVQALRGVLMTAPDADGYIHYNQSVPYASLPKTGGLSLAPAVVGGTTLGSGSGYSVFAKVYYKAATGLEPSFHGLASIERTTGIDNVELYDNDAPVEYYNLQGQRILNPAAGQVLIQRQGTRASKVLYR